MRTTLTWFAVVFMAGPLMAAELPPPTGESIVSPDAKLELLFTRTAKIQGGLTEGPAAAPDGSIYFSDIPVGNDKGLIMRFDPKTMETTIFAKDSGKSNGLICDANGFLIACEGADHGGRRVSRWNLRTGASETVADNYQGKHFNAPNDLCIDLKGRIYFTDPRYLGDEPRELKHRAVYRIDADGTVLEVTHDTEKPNGIAISPDQKTLYVADNNNGTDQISSDPKAPKPTKGAMKVYAFPLGDDGLVSGKRKTLYDFGKENGCDGIAMDVQGNIYLTAGNFKRPGVLVLNPMGQEIAFIPTGLPAKGDETPDGIPSNVDFGVGKESHVLYITVNFSLYRIPLKVEGYHIPMVAAGN